MKLYLNKYRTRNPRLPYWDYSSDGRYFITILIKNRERLLGSVVNKVLILSEVGQIVEQCWFELPLHYSNLQLGAFVIMPDHIHGIMIINNSMLKTGSERHELAEFIRGFKTFSTRRINEMNNTPTRRIWHSRYYERLIRNEKEYATVEQYIKTNPSRWV